MIRPLAALILLAAPAAADTLVGDWHCLQEGAEARVEAETTFGADGTMTARMEYLMVRSGSKIVVKALYAATWRLEGDKLWDAPLDARIIETTVDGTPRKLPQLTRGIRQSLMEPPDTPMQVSFPNPGFALMRGTGEGGGGTAFQCVRLGAETDL